jgi:hypothetical protein
MLELIRALVVVRIRGVKLSLMDYNLWNICESDETLLFRLFLRLWNIKKSKRIVRL